LPVRLPQTLLDHLTEQLSPPDIAAAEVAVDQTLSALHQTLDGYVPFPVWLEDALPEEESLPLIEQALAEGCNLQIDYYAAGSNTRTRRQVEPYRLEWPGETPYLVGYCHLAQSERVFRVDRIYSVVKVQSDEA
jgi:predicted DNA-binding transcriptional regulator YafY